MPDQQFGDVTVDVGSDHVATVEIHRPPSNFFDTELIHDLADAYQFVDDGLEGWAIVLCSTGRHFCAGADFHGASDAEPVEADTAGDLYAQAVRLFAAATPVVAAVQGAAIGGGLGLACSADLRVVTPESRLSANFARLGFHQGFGLSVTLPLIIGHQRSLDLLYTGRRLGGEEAHAIGLADRVATPEELRSSAHALAADIASSAPLAVRSIRQTLRGHLPAAVAGITGRENDEQARLRATSDFSEGLAAYAERRAALFTAS